MEQRLFNIYDAGRYLGRSPYSVRTLIWKGLIPVIQNPGDGKNKRMWIEKSDLDKYIKDNKKCVIRQY